MSNLDELLKLKELLDLGIINENDFKRKKAELFSNVNIDNEDSDSIKKEEIIIGIHEKECPSCKCIIEKESESCNFCDYDFKNKQIREEINYPIKSNNNLKKYISVFFLVVIFIFLGTWFFITNNSNRSNKLDLKNHKTEVENYQYELQQKEIEEQKRIVAEQKQKEAERISNDTTSTLSSEEVIRSRSAGYDAQAAEEKNTDIYYGNEDKDDIVNTYEENNSKVINRSPRPKDYANVFYDSDYTLFDLETDEPIFPDQYGEYNIWYSSNEDPTPKYKSLSTNDIQFFSQYKFKNKKNCTEWCRKKKQRK